MSRSKYVPACFWLARAGETLGLGQRLAPENDRIGHVSKRSDGQHSASREKMLKNLDTHATLADLNISPRTMVLAADAAGVISAVLVSACAATAFVLFGTSAVLPAALLLAIVPFAVRELLLAYPKTVAGRSANAVITSSAEAINLMIMCLRHEPSLSRAIRFASRRDGAFASELRKCEWKVLTGEFSSFEEALQDLGDRWSRFSGEIRSCINSMVTSTCESTEDGKRRALDRANQAMVSGAKRRVEDYILSLSTPSMVIFGLGVLLPLMVGSFLPMMSWNFWSIDGMQGGEMQRDGHDVVFSTIFLMNVLFPAIGLLAALNAVSRNPVRQRSCNGAAARPSLAWVALAGSTSVGATLFSCYALDGFIQSAAILMACLCPSALLLAGTRHRENPSSIDNSSSEDFLFRIGARMVEGQNFESAMRDSAMDSDDSAAIRMRLLSHDIATMGHGPDMIENETNPNSMAGLRVVSRAAAKDEQAAGILAMDLAVYLKDLRDIEGTLRSRLRPTISMMRMTSYVLGPVVLGVAYGIYLSLAAIVDNGTWTLDPRAFFLVLGFFLAESNAVVTYFVWALGSERDRSQFIRSLGWCILVASVVFSVTAGISS